MTQQEANGYLYGYMGVNSVQSFGEAFNNSEREIEGVDLDILRSEPDRMIIKPILRNVKTMTKEDFVAMLGVQGAHWTEGTVRLYFKRLGRQGIEAIYQRFFLEDILKMSARAQAMGYDVHGLIKHGYAIDFTTHKIPVHESK